MDINKMSTLAKFIVAFGIYAFWFALVIFHGADQKEFITWLQYALGFLAGIHVIPPVLQSYVASMAQKKPE